ncbi:MAG: hypothetical protein J6Y99_07585 [Bacteroidales bacterium]|nr:hypothetical protein [Bacteroidales bacterium]
MKKYIRPIFAVVEIETSQLMAESLSFCSKGLTTDNENEIQATTYRSNLWTED